MPYTAEDAMKHMDKADTLNKQKQWASVANSVMNKCMMDGGNEKDCSAKGIMQANGVITKLSEDSKDSFYYLTDISNIELVEKDFKLSLYNMPQPVVAYESHMDMYSIIDNFTGLIKQLTLGGYISIEELKQLTVIYLTRIDFSNSDQKMSEDLKFEISQYLEEYFEDKQLG